MILQEINELRAIFDVYTIPNMKANEAHVC